MSSFAMWNELSNSTDRSIDILVIFFFFVVSCNFCNETKPSTETIIIIIQNSTEWFNWMNLLKLFARCINLPQKKVKKGKLGNGWWTDGSCIFFFFVLCFALELTFFATVIIQHRNRHVHTRVNIYILNHPFYLENIDGSAVVFRN